MIRKQWGRCEDRRLARGQESRDEGSLIQGEARNEAEMRKKETRSSLMKTIVLLFHGYDRFCWMCYNIDI